eukprot:scaffold117366_cov22-Tisochrysis_lutea.AAC.1
MTHGFQACRATQKCPGQHKSLHVATQKCAGQHKSLHVATQNCAGQHKSLHIATQQPARLLIITCMFNGSRGQCHKRWITVPSNATNGTLRYK